MVEEEDVKRAGMGLAMEAAVMDGSRWWEKGGQGQKEDLRSGEEGTKVDGGRNGGIV